MDGAIGLHPVGRRFDSFLPYQIGVNMLSNEDVAYECNTQDIGAYLVGNYIDIDQIDDPITKRLCEDIKLSIELLHSHLEKHGFYTA